MRHIAFIVLFFTTGFVQTTLADPYGSAYHTGSRNLELLRNLWLDSRNAAGLSRQPVAEGGLGIAGVTTRRGDLWRVQEGNKTNRFFTEADQYQNLHDTLYFYGRFRFATERQFERSWSDVFDTYHSNPYLYGSAVKGSYDLQDFDLTGSMATRAFGALTYGLRLDYNVASLARLRDPRSLTNLADYAVIPAVTYELNTHHTLGLNLSYRHRKTKTPSVSTVQTDPNLKYYMMTGLEHATGTIGAYSSFQREFTGNSWGLSLDHAFQSSGVQALQSFLFTTTNQFVWGDIKASPGDYQEKELAYHAHLLIETQHILHKIDLQANHRQGHANEFRQQLVSVTDTATGIVSKNWETLFTYKSRYQTTVDLLTLQYRMFFLKGMQDYTAWTGLLTKYEKSDDQYNLPTSSFKDSRLTAGLEGGFRLINTGEHRLWIEPAALYSLSLNSTLTLQDETTDYAKAVWLKDQTYYQKNYLTGSVALKYEFPLHLGNNVRCAFVSLNGSRDWIQSGYQRWNAGLTAGVFFH